MLLCVEWQAALTVEGDLHVREDAWTSSVLHTISHSRTAVCWSNMRISYQSISLRRWSRPHTSLIECGSGLLHSTQRKSDNVYRESIQWRIGLDASASMRDRSRAARQAGQLGIAASWCKEGRLIPKHSCAIIQTGTRGQRRAMLILSATRRLWSFLTV